MPNLTDDETTILDFERSLWKYRGVKGQAIRDAFGVSPVVHYQRLDALLDRAEALVCDPLLVRPLRRLRAPAHGSGPHTASKPAGTPRGGCPVARPQR